MEIIIASHNLHKVREFREMLKTLASVDLLSLNDFPEYIAPDETGATFDDNAKLKALKAAQTLNRWAIADDSGIVVPALNNAPGVFSARYAGDNATDLENRRKLLKEMQGKKNLERAAYFECVIALASPEGTVKSVRGICEGLIATEERGRYGFGYDSIFMKHDYNQTFGELSDSVKNRISHRRKAFDKLALILESIILNNS